MTISTEWTTINTRPATAGPRRSLARGKRWSLRAGKRHISGQASPNGEAGQIREWANENGYELSGRGRIPSHVVEAYKEAKAQEAQQAAKPAAKRRTRAKKS